MSMKELGMHKLGLQEGDLIKRDTLDVIEHNMGILKSKLESIDYAEQMVNVPDVSLGGVNAQSVATTLNSLIQGFKDKGYMA